MTRWKLLKIYKPIPLNFAALASNPEYSSIISLAESSLLEPLMVSPVATPRLKSFICSDFSSDLSYVVFRLSKQNRLGPLSFQFLGFETGEMK